MKIRIKCFAKVREIIEKSDFDLDISGASTVQSALGCLEVDPSQLRDIQDSAMFAVNHKYVQLDYPLSDGDELAIIPPVSGG